MTIKASDEFFNFCALLNQGIILSSGPMPEDWVRGALQYSGKETLMKLRDELKRLIAGPFSDAELQELFRSTYTDMGIREDRGVRVFFQVVVDIIDGKPAPW